MTDNLRRGGGWPKGVSGNPGGRPKEIIEVVKAARERTAAALATLDRVMADEKASPSARVTAALGILERGWGKPMQSISLKREGEYKDLSDAELIAIASGAGDDAVTNGGSDPSATPDDTSTSH
jgi:hypothetical protein